MIRAKAKPLTQDRLDRIARALAEPRRHQILREIAGWKSPPMPCMALQERHPVSAATLSHHLRELEAAGLIEVTRGGKFMYLTVCGDVLNGYVAHLAEIAP